ncbi:MAG: hypothetical protein IIA67_04055 [Planctomycetes bacterium]|nr:hypothetical protein [Planctomycetota bacterium]
MTYTPYCKPPYRKPEAVDGRDGQASPNPHRLPDRDVKVADFRLESPNSPPENIDFSLLQRVN